MLNVKNYGATGTGTIDDRNAFEMAFADARTLLATQPVIVYIPQGIYWLNTVEAHPPSGFSNRIGIALPVNLTHPLTIIGDGIDKTIIKLSDNCRSAFWIDKQADYDVFRKVSFSDISLDNNNSAGICNAFVGNIVSSNSKQNYLSFEDICATNISGYNMPVDVTQAVQKGLFAFVGVQNTPNEPTQTHSKNITFDNVQQIGGDYCCIVASFWSIGQTNHYYDQIEMLNSRHDTGLVPVASLSQVSFFIAGSGWGDYGAIINCYSENSGDDSYEWGAMKYIYMSNCFSKNAFLNGLLFRNAWTAGPDYKAVIDNYSVILTSAMSGRGTGVAFDSTAGTYGNITLNDFSFAADGLKTLSVNNGCLVYSSATSIAREVNFIRPKITITNYNYDAPNTRDISAFLLNSPVGMPVNIDDLYLKFQATRTGAGTMNLVGVKVDGGLANINGYCTDYSGTGSTGVSNSVVAVAKTAGTAPVKLTIRGINVLYPAPANMFGVRIYSTATINFFYLIGNNFSASTGTDIETGSIGSNASKFIQADNVLHTAGPVAGTVGQLQVIGPNLAPAWTTLFLSASQALDFNSTAAQSSSDLTISLPGAVIGDTVVLGTPISAINNNSDFTAFVSAADLITVRFNNYSATAIDPGPATFKVTVIRV